MARVVEYAAVLERMTGDGLRCDYHSSGAFSFPDVGVEGLLGWVGPADATIRAALLPRARQVSEPYPQVLAGLVVRAWREELEGPAWLMPASHWAYELEFGNAEWLPGTLEGLGIDAGTLRRRTDGSAIELASAGQEGAAAGRFLETMFERMAESDFRLAFPGRPAIAHLHHHQQVWWQARERAVIERLEAF